MNFCHLDPLKFQGETDLLTTVGWLRQTVITLDVIGVIDDAIWNFMVVYQLIGPARL